MYVRETFGNRTTQKKVKLFYPPNMFMFVIFNNNVIIHSIDNIILVI